MKIPLCLCTIWSSIYIYLSDGGNLIEEVQKIEYYVGSIGGLDKSYQYNFFIHCTGPCEIVDVTAEFMKEGVLRLRGYYGDERKKFCQGRLSNGTGIAKCTVLEYAELLSARIHIDTLNRCRYVRLTARGKNLLRFSDKPQSAKDQMLSVAYDPGSTIWNKKHLFWILCRGPCIIEEVTATKGHGTLYVKSDSETLCAKDWYSEIGKCTIKKKTRPLSRPRINMACYFKCDNVELTVLGVGLIGIFDKPPSPKKITTHVGTLDKNQNMKFTLDFTEGANILKHISVTFNIRGDVRMAGPIKNGIDSYFPNTFGNNGPKKCPDLIKNPSITLYGHEKSENVTLTVIGPYLKRVHHERTWYTRQP